ncbi:PhaM family polyhydroxyalkanoate granule multifunctional regulatory protein [Paraburkholderia ginsengisoli]|uniref:Transcriptional regulator n=1 Tax=Paraburkholderia ginsengisoli TaxID=311231 RepID=A0A7T4N023_9BURK|nr:PhaM family polyhydroxyalkanoate granule multifunctional regulatory protein [Paraburkholderia ginsengisoli]QQC62710.1 transcriptional regulator [Paraburkholderia ginsengisoli]
MTDTTDSTPPFPGFPGFPPAEMLERMWGMMRLSPFGSALPGAQAGGALGPSLSMMSDMMAPLTNVEELDKRITDMRAVEQWLKLNLSMLQSAIQALEVQRATLATLRAFGAFAQSSMAQPTASAAPSPAPASGWPHPAAPTPAPAAQSAAPSENAASADNAEEDTPATPPFDASAWWNLLQSQFNQIAQFAMTQPAAAGGEAATDSAQETMKASAAGGATGHAAASKPTASPATKRPAAKRASTSAKRASGSTAKKSI